MTGSTPRFTGGEMENFVSRIKNERVILGVPPLQAAPSTDSARLFFLLTKYPWP